MVRDLSSSLIAPVCAGLSFGKDLTVEQTFLMDVPLAESSPDFSTLAFKIQVPTHFPALHPLPVAHVARSPTGQKERKPVG